MNLLSLLWHRWYGLLSLRSSSGSSPLAPRAAPKVQERLKLEDFKLRVERIYEEAKALAEELGPVIDKFEEDHRNAVNRLLREALVSEIDKIEEAVLKKAEEVEEEIFYEGEEVWARAIAIKNGGKTLFHFDATTLGAKYARSFALEVEVEGRGRYTQIEEFKRRVERLRSLILSGKLDKVLNMTAEEVVWEIMGYTGKLIEDVKPERRLHLEQRSFALKSSVELVEVKSGLISSGGDSKKPQNSTDTCPGDPSTQSRYH